MSSSRIGNSRGRLRSRSSSIGGRLHVDDVTCLYRDLARAAGIDPARISSHSARVGQTQDLVAAGFDLAGVMQAGRWKSPAMVARYFGAGGGRPGRDGPVRGQARRGGGLRRGPWKS